MGPRLTWYRKHLALVTLQTSSLPHVRCSLHPSFVFILNSVTFLLLASQTHLN